MTLSEKGESFQTAHLSELPTFHLTGFTQGQFHLYCWVFYLKVWRGMQGRKAQERRAMPWKGKRPSLQPSSACGWWIKLLWWQQNKQGLELWPAHSSQPPLEAAPSQAAVKHRNLSPTPAGIVLPAVWSGCLFPSALSHSFCCCNSGHHRNLCEWVLGIPWVLLTRDIGVV